MCGINNCSKYYYRYGVYYLLLNMIVFHHYYCVSLIFSNSVLNIKMQIISKKTNSFAPVYKLEDWKSYTPTPSQESKSINT